MARYFFAGQVLSDLREERALGRRWLWTLPALARKHGCAFVLVQVPRRREGIARWLLRRGEPEAFYLPLFVGATVDLTDRTRLLRSRDLRDDVRRVRNRGFQASVTRKKEDLETFIRHYHDPYVRNVHGFDALAMDFNRILVSCTGDQIPEPWVLLKIEREGEWVAGDLLKARAGEAALVEVGVKDANPAYVRRGALQAAYWLSLEYLRAEGKKWVGLMHARPFLRSGVLQYKLKFSPYLSPAFDGFLLLPDWRSEAAREILLREPFLAFRGDELRAVWFSRDPAADAYPACIPVERLAVAGIKHIERVSLANEGSPSFGLVSLLSAASQ